MARNPAIALGVSPRHFRTGQTTSTGNHDAFSAQAHGPGDRLAHGPLVRDAALKLLGNAFGNQISIQFRTPDLGDIHLDPLAGQLLQLGAQGIDIGALRPMMMPGLAVWIHTWT